MRKKENHDAAEAEVVEIQEPVPIQSGNAGERYNKVIRYLLQRQ